MKILFIGDSLVKGAVGVNWVKWLASKNPAWEVENAGKNGETLKQITIRLQQKLAQGKYDMVFFEAGINDLLLPTLKAKNYLFRQSEKYTSKDAQLCDNAETFELTYREAVQTIKNTTNATIILSTLGCLNENLEHSLNKKRCAYNDVIRDVAIETGCGLVDAGALFDGYLRRCRTRDYLLEGFWNTWCLDKFQCSVLGCPDYLSKRRGLHLTIDGVHLNSRGANIFRDETERQIKSVMSGFTSEHRSKLNGIEIF